MHVRYFLDAGPLWRDEANTESLSRLPSLGALWENLQYDSFPLLWHLVLRAWRVGGPGETESGLRALGLVVGLSLAGALWIASLRLGNGAPVISLPLLGLNAAAIAYGDSIRGYGLGMTTGILAFGSVWHLANSGRRSAVLPAFVASIAAVHALFHNVVVVAAIVLAGLAVCARARAWRRAALVAAVGLGAALSVLPYVVPIRQVRAWNETVKAAVSPASILQKLFEALSVSGAAMPWVWAVLVLLSLALAAAVAASPSEPAPGGSRADRALYGGVALAAALAGYGIFLLVLSYPTQPWYYLALLGLAAVCVETCLGSIPRTAAGEAMRLAAGLAIALVAAPGAWQAAGTRRTNVDLVAARIKNESRKEDLVVVSPWYLGVTFERHYRGPAPWLTLPPIAFHRYHRYDLLQREIANPRAMEPLLREVRAVLAGGHRVWWVGEAPSWAAPGSARRASAPAAGNRSASADAAAYERWEDEAGALFGSLSARVEPVRVAEELRVDPYERVRLTVFQAGSASPDPSPR